MTISYTFPVDCPVPQLRGVTCEGGVFSTAVLERKLVDVCIFTTRIDGKAVSARVAGKPVLMAALAAQKDAIAVTAVIKRAALESAIPGMAVYEAAMHNYTAAAAAYDRASEYGYPAREAMAASAADQALQTVFAEFPATQLWRQIVAAQESSHYARSSAGDHAAAAVLAGMPIAEAVAAMNAE